MSQQPVTRRTSAPPLRPDARKLAARKSTLTPSRARLVEVLQAVNYGRIENLPIVDGEPTFSPPPRVVRNVLLDRDAGRRPEIAAADFVLRREVAALFEHMTTAAPGSTMTITVQAGLPVRLQIAGALEA